MYVSTHNETRGSSGDAAFAGVGIGSSENVPQFRDDCLLSERIVVLWAQGQVTNQPYQGLQDMGDRLYRTVGGGELSLCGLAKVCLF